MEAYRDAYMFVLGDDTRFFEQDDDGNIIIDEWPKRHSKALQEFLSRHPICGMEGLELEPELYFGRFYYAQLVNWKPFTDWHCFCAPFGNEIPRRLFVGYRIAETCPDMLFRMPTTWKGLGCSCYFGATWEYRMRKVVKVDSPDPAPWKVMEYRLAYHGTCSGGFYYPRMIGMKWKFVSCTNLTDKEGAERVANDMPHDSEPVPKDIVLHSDPVFDFNFKLDHVERKVSRKKKGA